MTARRDHAGLLGRILADLGSADALSREDAARALDRAEVRPADEPLLVEAFRKATERASRGPLSGKALERDEASRAPLARALARLGAGAREAVPELVRALERGGPELADEAVFALEVAGPDEAASLLVGRLEEGDGAARLEALRAIQHASFVLEPRLAYARLRRDATLAPRLARALAERGEAALLLACDEPQLRPHALSVLGYLGPQLGQKDKALSLLLSALEAGEGTIDEATRLSAASAIGFWGEEAAVAVPKLASLLSGPLAAAAAESLGRMGEAALPVLPALERSLASLDRPSRESILSAIARLQELGEAAPPAPLPPRVKPAPREERSPEKAETAPPRPKAKPKASEAPSLKALLGKAKAAAAATKKKGAGKKGKPGRR